jgi:hypothetical protein
VKVDLSAKRAVEVGRSRAQREEGSGGDTRTLIHGALEKARSAIVIQRVT